LKRATLPLEPSKEVLERLDAYRWPGNVRELENVVRRAIAMRSWDFVMQQFHPSDSDAETGPSFSAPEFSDPIADHFKKGHPSLREITASYVSAIERKAIVAVLDSVRWDRQKAAKILGVSYKTVCNRIRDLAIGPKNSM
jgi:two-component system, NtrC family, response regulator AtoC